MESSVGKGSLEILLPSDFNWLDSEVFVPELFDSVVIEAFGPTGLEFSSLSVELSPLAGTSCPLFSFFVTSPRSSLDNTSDPSNRDLTSSSTFASLLIAFLHSTVASKVLAAFPTLKVIKRHLLAPSLLASVNAPQALLRAVEVPVFRASEPLPASRRRESPVQVPAAVGGTVESTVADRWLGAGY